MTIQILVATMNRQDFSLPEQMNIQGDALIINQADRLADETHRTVDSEWRMVTLPERGVGRSRNNALLRASADICLLADDDVRYHDGYETIIQQAFARHSHADVLLFNVPCTNPDRSSAFIAREHRVRFYNFMRYPAFQIAFRRERVVLANVFFSLLFGGGATYSAGEDTLFLADCLRRGLRIVACTEEIGTVTHQHSTWFNGYNDTYFHDKGVFFTALSRRWAVPLMLQFAVRKRKLYRGQMTFMQAMRAMLRGRDTYAD